MRIVIVRDPIELSEVRVLALETYRDMVKGVADIRQGIIALGGEWHADANTELIRNGSLQTNVWGFNIYPDESGKNALEYISLINIRPAQGNREMELKHEGTRDAIRAIIKRLIPGLPL